MGPYVPTPKFFYNLWGPRESDLTDVRFELTTNDPWSVDDAICEGISPLGYWQRLNPGPISTKGTRASCALPIGHGPSSATGTRANSTVPLSRGINSATGGRVSNAAPLNHGKGTALRAPLPPATRRTAMRMLRRRVALLRERVHPLLVLTRWWR